MKSILYSVTDDASQNAFVYILAHESRAAAKKSWAAVTQDPENLRAVERLTRIALDAIDYEFTIHDPATYTSPWTAKLPMLKFDGRIYEYACHEGNYGLVGILSGARAQEQAAEEAAKKR